MRTCLAVATILAASACASTEETYEAEIGLVSSSTPLVAELARRRPDAPIWPDDLACDPEDCAASAGGPFRQGVWKVVDLDCVRDGSGTEDGEADCSRFVEWRLTGVFHPAYGFSTFGPDGDRLGDEAPIFLADISALLGAPPTQRYFLLENGLWRPRYSLMVEDRSDRAGAHLHEHALQCPTSPRSRGYTLRGESFRSFLGVWCDILNLDGLEAIARSAAARPAAFEWSWVAASREEQLAKAPAD